MRVKEKTYLESIKEFIKTILFALLIAVYPANIYMAITPNAFPEIPIYILYFRLALQFVFFYWAYSVTRENYN